MFTIFLRLLIFLVFFLFFFFFLSLFCFLGLFGFKWLFIKMQMGLCVIYVFMFEHGVEFVVELF